MPPSQIEPQTAPAAAQTTDADESCSKCIFDRLPPEMVRFIFRKQSTDDLLQASAITDRLYRVAQHHMYLSEGALLVRGGQDTAETVARTYDVRHVAALYLVDVRDFDRDAPRPLPSRETAATTTSTATTAASNTATSTTATATSTTAATTTLRTLHVGYTRPVGYADVSEGGGLRRLLCGARAGRVCFDNVLMTAADVADAVTARLEADGPSGPPAAPPVFRCSYDRADDAAVLELLDRVEATCAGLLAEFRVTVRRPAPRAFSVYPPCRPADDDDDYDGAGREAASVAAELPEDLLSLTATDCSGLAAAAYRRLGTACHRLRRVSLRSARRLDDGGFAALAAMPCIRHLHVHGATNVTSDGLLNGLERAHELRSLALAGCPYVTDEVLRRAGDLRQLRRLLLDLSGCDKTTAAGVHDMLTGGCERVHELRLTLPLDADYVDAVTAAAAALPRLRAFRLTFDRLWPLDRADDRRRAPAAADWERRLVARFRARHVDLDVRHSFTKITVSVD